MFDVFNESYTRTIYDISLQYCWLCIYGGFCDGKAPFSCSPTKVPSLIYVYDCEYPPTLRFDIDG